MKKKLLLLVPVIALNLLSAAPLIANAQDYGTKTTADAAGLATNLDLAQKVGQTINIVIGAIGLVFLILATYGGIKILTSRGDSAAINKGKETLLYAVIGMIVIAGAYALTDYVIKAVASK